MNAAAAGVASYKTPQANPPSCKKKRKKSFLWGDPHIVTFDGFTFDCQAAGTFLLAKSPSILVQSQFTEVAPDGWPTVTRGIAVKKEGASTVQVSIPINPRDSSSMVNHCPVNLFVDGEKRGFNTFDICHPLMEPAVFQSDKTIEIYSGGELEISLTVRRSNRFGCFFLFSMGLQESSEEFSGLMGSPNGNPADDWTAAFPKLKVSVSSGI